ncbi:MAG: 1-deoxy-D-xylulose-5-phosphate reductoisomerase [Thermoanaerobaculia bacterium]
MRRRITVLGSTGSVGRSALEVVRRHPERLEVVGLAARGSHPRRLIEQILEFRPARVAVVDAAAAARVREAIPGGVEVVEGAAGLAELAADAAADRVLAALVGVVGLPAVHAALAAGRDVALANKESLVVAGALLLGVARRTGARVLPVDSEHAALHQAMQGAPADAVHRLVLTASGGPFRLRDEDFAGITPGEALAHPTWQMGPRITVDSATLMNKGFEVIEAVHLFGLPLERVDVVVHPQSQVHALVEYSDGTWLAQLAPNDMVFPVQYALGWPERWASPFERLEPSRLGRLDFEPVDEQRFPALRLAREAFRLGPSGPAVLNAADEIAVEAFLAERLPFSAIPGLVAAVLEDHQPGPVDDLEGALAWDRWGRQRARELLPRFAA